MISGVRQTLLQTNCYSILVNVLPLSNGQILQTCPVKLLSLINSACITVLVTCCSVIALYIRYQDSQLTDAINAITGF